MAIDTRPFLAGCMAGLLMAGCTCTSPPRGAAGDPPETPQELVEPGLRLWEGKRDTWTILTAPRLGYVTQILLEPRGAAPNELLLVGTRAALRTLASPVRAEWVELEDPGDESFAFDAETADLDADGTYEFFNRSGNWHPASVYDDHGRILWRHGLEWGVDQMAPGHLDDDGELDFVVGMLGDGLRRLDSHGNVVWQLPIGTVFDVELADLDGDGGDEILHSTSRGHFVVRSRDGTTLSDVQIEPAVLEFGVTRWGSPNGSLRVAYLRGSQLWLVRPDGSQQESLDVGIDSRFGRPSLASMRRGDGQREGLALLVDYRVFDRSLLNLYDADGALFYQQVLPWSCPSLEVDFRDPEADVLLLGCNGRLVGNGPNLSVYRRSLALNEAFEGPDSPNLIEDLTAIAWSLVHLDREAEAIPYAERAVGIAERASVDDNRLAKTLNSLGMVEAELGRLDRASSLLHRALGLVGPELPRGTRIRSDIHYNLGRVSFAQARWDEAERYYREALAGTEFPADRAKAAYNLARLYLDQGRFEEAERMALRAVEEDSTAYSATHAEVRKDLGLYARILRSAGRGHEAEEIEARLGSEGGGSPPPAAPDIR